MQADEGGRLLAEDEDGPRKFLAFMVFLWFSWFFYGFLWFSWFFYVFLWFSWFFSGRFNCPKAELKTTASFGKLEQKCLIEESQSKGAPRG